jgi:hypothetical protein
MPNRGWRRWSLNRFEPMLTTWNSPANARPEEELLLRCARVSVGSDPVERVAELVPHVTDWEYIFQLASRHAVTPLVSHVFNQLDNCNVPIACVPQLQAASRIRTARSLELTASLLELLSLFGTNSIPALAFKGPVLAYSLYGNVGLRDFVDLDILIRRQDVVKAKNVMLAHGYRTDLPTNPAQEVAYLRTRHELHFSRDDDSCPIEIHQAFLPPSYRFDYDYDSLWRRLDRTIFYGREIFSLSSDDLLLVLCAHGAKHRWPHIGWICDVARLLAVSGEKLDWPQLKDRAASMGATRLLLLGVFLANRVLGAPVPLETLSRTDQDGYVNRLSSEVTTAFFTDPSIVSDIVRHRFFLQARERFRDKFWCCTRLAFVPTEEDTALLSLPSFLSPLSYPLHAVRVMAKYGFAALNGVL